MDKVQLVDNIFTPTEASDIVTNLINEKINFHKLQRLSQWEGDINSDTSFDDNRVAKLTAESKAFKQICQEAKLNGKKIKINGVLEIEILD